MYVCVVIHYNTSYLQINFHYNIRSKKLVTFVSSSTFVSSFLYWPFPSVIRIELKCINLVCVCKLKLIPFQLISTLSNEITICVTLNYPYALKIGPRLNVNTLGTFKNITFLIVYVLCMYFNLLFCLLSTLYKLSRLLILGY